MKLYDTKKVTFFILLLICFKTIEANSQSLAKHATVVVDCNTGDVLHQENADKLRYPASLTKMMTIYLTFEQIKYNKLRFDQYFIVSENAAQNPSSKLGLLPGQRITVKDLIMASIIKSANDAAVVLSEGIAGNEEDFAKLMTIKAKQLGMHYTSFKNASGLHHIEQKTTAYDMAKLGIALNRDFPEYYHLFAKTSFIYKNKIYYGHNKVLKKLPGANGLKTGFINASGYNIVTTANRGRNKLIAVVMGGETSHARDTKTIQLLNRFFGDRTITTNSLVSNKDSKITKNSHYSKNLGKKNSNKPGKQKKNLKKR